MDYQVKAVKDGDNVPERGYKLFYDGIRYYSVWMQDGEPDPETWAILNRCGERDTPIFTREFCEYQGYDRTTYDIVTVID